jgi:hypothetical protein
VPRGSSRSRALNISEVFLIIMIITDLTTSLPY